MKDYIITLLKGSKILFAGDVRCESPEDLNAIAADILKNEANQGVTGPVQVCLENVVPQGDTSGIMGVPAFYYRSYWAEL